MEERDDYDLENMAKRLGISAKTLKNRISAGVNHPPYIRPSRGEYQFPKDLYERWRRSLVEEAIAS